MSQLNDFLKKSSAYAVRAPAHRRSRRDRRGEGHRRGRGERGARRRVRAAGADVPGVLWLDDKWQLDTPKDLTVAADGARSVDGQRRRVARSPRCASSRRGSRAAGGETAARRATSIEPLRSAGLPRLHRRQEGRSRRVPGRARRACSCSTGTDSHLAATDTMVDFVQSLLDAERADGARRGLRRQRRRGPSAPKRGAALEPVRGDPALAKRVTTFDDAELPQGAADRGRSRSQQIADGHGRPLRLRRGRERDDPAVPS